jgi:hypothetical protein
MYKFPLFNDYENVNSTIRRWINYEFLTDPGGKKRKWIKNASIGTVAGFMGGLIGAELTDIVSDSYGLISFLSTIGESIGGAIIIPLYTKDNPDLYRDKLGKLKKNTLVKDWGKYGLTLVAFYAMLIGGRTTLNYYLLNKGFDTSSASLLSDCVFGTVHMAGSYCLARGTGLIRYEPELESNATIEDIIDS